MDWLSGMKEIIGSAIPFFESIPAIRAILAFILMFFLPGFAWTLVFFGRKQINILERLVISFGLSIAVVALTIFALNRLVGMGISGFNALVIIIVVTAIPLLIYLLKRLTSKEEDTDE